MPKNFKFRDTEDEELTQLVQNNPVLYDPKHPDYKNRNIKNSVWMTIANRMGKNEIDCKKRWRDIRDNYHRFLRRERVSTSSSSSQSKWPLYDKLKFLDAFYYVSRDRTSLALSTVTSDSDATEEPVSHQNFKVECDNSSNGTVSEEINEDVDSQPTKLVQITREYPTPNVLSTATNQVHAIRENPTPNVLSTATNQVNPIRENSTLNVLSTASTQVHTVRENGTPIVPSTTAAIPRAWKRKQTEHVGKNSNKRMEVHEYTAKKGGEDDDIDLFMKSIALSVRKLPTDLVSQAKMDILMAVLRLEKEALSRQNHQ